MVCLARNSWLEEGGACYLATLRLKEKGGRCLTGSLVVLIAASSSVWLAGPTLALKVQGASHTLSATSLSEVALRRTCTESIKKKSTLKTALTKKN